MSASRPINAELEGVRGIACLMVALSHVFYVTPLDPSIVLPPWLRTMEAGHAGVLIFFVLSGYLISWTNAGPCTPASRSDYLWRRYIRLAPIYYIALVLTAAVTVLKGVQGQVPTLVASFFGLQNFNDYFGVLLNVPASNSPLWSLNYELLYYGAFIALWCYQPRLAFVLGPALVAGLLTWFTPNIMPIFLGSYSCGWLFWSAGWWLARLPRQVNGLASAPALTWLLLIYSGYRIMGVTRILNALGWYSNDAGMVNLGNLGLLPPILLLLAAITNRQLPFRRIHIGLAWLVCLVPLAGMIWTDRLWSNPNWISGGISVLLAVAALLIRSIDWLNLFVWVGSISYAFYVVHFPLLFVVQRLPLPVGTIPAYLLRMLVWSILSLNLAWFLERRFQPWIKVRFSGLKSV